MKTHQIPLDDAIRQGFEPLTNAHRLNELGGAIATLESAGKHYAIQTTLDPVPAPKKKKGAGGKEDRYELEPGQCVVWTFWPCSGKADNKSGRFKREAADRGRR